MLDLMSRRKVKADRGRRPRKPPERVCVMDAAGKVLARGKVASDPEALFEVCLASPRHALLAESLGKPSLWVIINGPWYKGFAERRRHREGCAVGYMQSKV